MIGYLRERREDHPKLSHRSGQGVVEVRSVYIHSRPELHSAHVDHATETVLLVEEVFYLVALLLGEDPRRYRVASFVEVASDPGPVQLLDPLADVSGG